MNENFKTYINVYYNYTVYIYLYVRHSVRVHNTTSSYRRGRQAGPARRNSFIQ